MSIDIKLLTHRLIFITMLVLWSVSLVFTQSGDDLMDLSLDDLLNLEVTVASNEGENIFNSVSSVSVIDAEMIAKFNFETITEALKTVAGFDVLRTYLKRDIPTSRGITQDHYANKVLVMINNIPTWHAVTGEANIDRINIKDVARIEVLKGPASVLYGTNAYSGAVNIVLKDDVTDGQAATYLSYGDEGTFQAGGRAVLELGDAKVMLSGNASDETGHDIVFTGEGGNSGHMKEYAYGSNFNLNLDYRNHSILFNVFQFHESYYGVAPKWGKGVGNDHPSEGRLINYTYQRSLDKGLKLNAAFTYDWNQRNLSRTDDDSIRANILGNRMLAHVGVSKKLSAHYQFETGVDYEVRTSQEYENYYTYLDQKKEDNYMANRETTEYSGFGQLGMNYEKMKLLFGARYTNNEIFGDNVSGRATAVVPLGSKSSLKIIAGQSYRAPSLFELYFRTSGNTVFGSTYSDVDMQPETSNSVELAYLVSVHKLFVQALAYYATYENKIFRDKKDVVIGDVTYENKSVYANGENFDASGLELELRYIDPSVLSWFLNYYFVNGGKGDEISGWYNFKAVPKQALTAGAYKPVGNFLLSAVVNYQSATVGPNDEATKKIDALSTVDINLGYKQNVNGRTIRHNISVKNVGDVDVLIPEYVRRKTAGLNSVPLGYGRRIQYTLSLDL